MRATPRKVESGGTISMHLIRQKRALTSFYRHSSRMAILNRQHQQQAQNFTSSSLVRDKQNLFLTPSLLKPGLMKRGRPGLCPFSVRPSQTELDRRCEELSQSNFALADFTAVAVLRVSAD